MERKVRYLWRLAAALSALSLGSPAVCQTSKRQFTPVDDVGLTQFNWYKDSEPDPARDIKVSPNHRYFVIAAQKGRLDLNAPEDTIWLFHMEDVERAIRHPSQTGASLAIPLVTSTSEEVGPNIEHVRWLSDSSAVVFTQVVRSRENRFHQLTMADVKTGKITPLTPSDQDVYAFDVRSGSRYVYAARASQALDPPQPSKLDEPAVLSDLSLEEVLFPSEHLRIPGSDRGELWAVIDGKKRRVLEADSYETPHQRTSLALSPDGRHAVTILYAQHPPPIWKRYKPEPVNRSYWEASPDSKSASTAYYSIDLLTGERKPLIEVPTGDDLEWTAFANFAARWSKDGKSLILPDLFLPLNDVSSADTAERENGPWIAVLRLDTGRLTGVLQLKGGTWMQHDMVNDAYFADERTVVLRFNRILTRYHEPDIAVFKESPDGAWQRAAGGEDPLLAELPVKLEVREGIDQPPIILGTDRATGKSMTLWDPNPQLKDLELGLVEPIRWKDDTGYEYQGAILKPPGYVRGKRYPLVIQPYAFNPRQFLSHGRLTSGTAARALNAVGIIVVQASMRVDGAALNTPQEGPNAVSKFDSIVKKLSDEGLVDPARVGALGFSRTVFHVNYNLAFSEHPLAAASISDGFDFGYFEEIMYRPNSAPAAPLINGGDLATEMGLKSWLAHSPEFNMQKVHTPVLILSTSPSSAAQNWEEFELLRLQHKPADILMLPTPVEHELSNPKNRVYSETLYTDWFDFWLNGHEDPVAGKVDQYRRWEKLCDLQIAANPGQPTFCVSSKKPAVH
jgi:dipeptidyl aminopeptidase/acylaminoacyl peptidase